MFDKGYNSEKTIKGIAKKIGIVAIAVLAIAFLAAFIVLCIDADIWWISLIILGAGIIVCSCFMASAHLVYGFGELVGNSKRIASGSSKEKVDIKELEKKITDLPKM